MFDGCVGKETRNARRRRCSTHTHTRRRRRRDREGLGGGRLKSPHTQKTLSFSVFTKGTRDDFPPLGECTLESHFWMLSCTCRFTCCRINVRAPNEPRDRVRRRRSSSPRDSTVNSSVEAGRRGSAIRIGDGSRHAPAHHEYALYQYHRTNVTLKFTSRDEESCY